LYYEKKNLNAHGSSYCCIKTIVDHIKVPGYPQADSVIKHAWKEIFAGIKHLWGGMNVAVSNF
jgi:hypothetical protein